MPVLVLALACAGCRAPAGPPVLNIAAASDLQFALDEIAKEYRASHPQLDVRIAYGSSGNFYSQIRGGAPFDLFLSADVEYPRLLATKGLADADSLFVYGTGRIVVWAPANSPLDLEHLQMGALEAPSVKHIAIANPKHAPYGRAAELAMRTADIYDRVAPKLVLGENISQTLEFVQSGAAEVGIVALSLALAPTVHDHGKYWEIPLDWYPQVQQGGAILKRSKSQQAARDFRAFLMNGAGAQTLRRYGFYLPGK